MKILTVFSQNHLLMGWGSLTVQSLPPKTIKLLGMHLCSVEQNRANKIKKNNSYNKTIIKYKEIVL